MCFTMTQTARGINTEQKKSTSHTESKGPFDLGG